MIAFVSFSLFQGRHGILPGNAFTILEKHVFPSMVFLSSLEGGGTLFLEFLLKISFPVSFARQKACFLIHYFANTINRNLFYFIITRF